MYGGRLARLVEGHTQQAPRSSITQQHHSATTASAAASTAGGGGGPPRIGRGANAAKLRVSGAHMQCSAGGRAAQSDAARKLRHVVRGAAALLLLMAALSALTACQGAVFFGGRPSALFSMLVYSIALHLVELVLTHHLVHAMQPAYSKLIENMLEVLHLNSLRMMISRGGGSGLGGGGGGAAAHKATGGKPPNHPMVEMTAIDSADNLRGGGSSAKAARAKFGGGGGGGGDDDDDDDDDDDAVWVKRNPLVKVSHIISPSGGADRARRVVALGCTHLSRLPRLGHRE